MKKNTIPEPLRLDAAHNQNWNVDAGPVAVLNEASTAHERIAYCWGLANQIKGFALILSSTRDSDIHVYGEILSSFAGPLEAMLDRLGDDTREAAINAGAVAGGMP
jgi:hypothetical protein